MDHAMFASRTRYLHAFLAPVALLALASPLSAETRSGYVAQKLPLEAPAVGLAFDAHGALWVLEEAGFGNNVAHLRPMAPDGSFGAAVEIEGDDPNNFFVGGMAYDPLADRLLITDNTADGRLYAVADGVRQTLATGLSAIAGVAVRSTGEIFVSTALGPGQGGVFQVDRQTGAASPVLGGLDFGAGLAFDNAGDLLVQDAAATAPYLGRLRRVPISQTPGGLSFGQPTPVIDAASAAAGVLVDSEGDVFVTGRGGVYQLSGEPAMESAFFSDDNPQLFATAITLSPDATPFEPFSGPARRVLAVADYGFAIEQPAITLLSPAAPEDFNSSGQVDAGDLAVWSQSFGLSPAGPAIGDADGDGIVAGADLLRWQQSYGASVLLDVSPAQPPVTAVPEPPFCPFLAFFVLFAWQNRARR
ncbi:MAG: hypothetical protein DCC67_06640 [Planctomycetota bacterium]|nr:MAG: hypothetical protein DCC67_06640 [Planctomycetota bacterium]